MINEERVTEMFHLAMYDSKLDRRQDQMESYYGRDYIGKELLKSFFTGTFAFCFLVLFAGLGLLGQAEEIFDSMDLVGTIVSGVLMYLAWEVVYLIITAAVYRRRFRNGRLRLKKYAKSLKAVNKMYTREEKLKS